ncbi:hypothetical protein DPMN_102782 [Dreissena polymorpha]|uniref:Uncharacterized protein n=1 Tax=Dreissena polymorpha TaxID=45954 RepID=A0A9D4KJ65_DREPO|nr:hypothetical protein DPMN_043713 [Dreissena polymorpha]KAH3840528.1 hypothetical protein DPMN_113978 [Dreissena polymorpha]KAH3859961.1 hypothetical protein DPMN_102782 [Dreissena polymorpha]
MVRQRPTRLVMWPCIVEIDRIVIREVHYQLEVNWCRIEEIIVKGNFGWAWPMWAGCPRIDRIVIREVQYQFEVNRCRNEEIIVKGNFWWVWPMWAGRSRVDNGAEVPYQFEVNRCRNEEIIVKGIFGLAWPMWVGFPRVDSFVIRKVQYQFEWEWPMWAGPPGLVMGPCIVEIYRIVIREVWYQFEDNQCRNEEIIFQGSSAYSVGGDSGQARTDGRRRYPQYDQYPHAFQKVQSNITGILPRPTMTNRALIYTLKYTYRLANYFYNQL